jgi:hypothetical protein
VLAPQKQKPGQANSESVQNGGHLHAILKQNDEEAQARGHLDQEVHPSFYFRLISAALVLAYTVV